MQEFKRPFKIGQTVVTPDGKRGKILFFCGYKKDADGQTIITEVSVLVSRFASIYPIQKLAAVEERESEFLPPKTAQQPLLELFQVPQGLEKTRNSTLNQR